LRLVVAQPVVAGAVAEVNSKKWMACVNEQFELNYPFRGFANRALTAARAAKYAKQAAAAAAAALAPPPLATNNRSFSLLENGGAGPSLFFSPASATAEQAKAAEALKAVEERSTTSSRVGIKLSTGWSGGEEEEEVTSKDRSLEEALEDEIIDIEN
jgi:hypothetical protein